MIETNGTVIAYISVGSNIDPYRNIEAGFKALLLTVTVLDVSVMVASKPSQRAEQADFINGVWKIETVCPALELKFEVLRDIERLCGRTRGEDKHAARTLDLDLLCYGDVVLQSKELTLPDPDIYTAPYIAVPLADLAPDLILPDTGRRVRDLKSATRLDGLSPLVEFTELLKGWLNK
jgi:2-amino-4-hydroxy-6-hydroxymethyldihydropteridine diphosphokinase